MSDKKTVESNEPAAAGGRLASNVPSPLLIAMLGQLGNIGKSTLAALLVHANLGGNIYSVETRNQDASRFGVDVKKFDVEDMRELRIELMQDLEHAIVDVGASCFDTFVKQIVLFNMVRTFDFVIVVADPTDRGQAEAIATFRTITQLGVPPGKTRIVLNRANVDKEVVSQFPILFEYHHHEPAFPLNPGCVLPVLPVISELSDQGISWKDVVNDRTDHLAAARAHRANGKSSEALKAAERALLIEWAHGARAFLDNAFLHLNLTVPPRHG